MMDEMSDGVGTECIGTLINWFLRRHKMHNISEIIGRIGDFYFAVQSQVFEITGVLEDSNGRIKLNARINEEILRKVKLDNEYQIWGTVDGIDITLLGCYVFPSCRCGKDTIFANLLAEPSEIIIGRSCSGDLKITKISAAISALNYMLPRMPFKQTVTSSKDAITIESVLSWEEISACAKYGKVSFKAGLSCNDSWEKVEYISAPSVEYHFSKPTSIKEAIPKIASVRNLFSFFADHYLPLENMEFADEDTRRLESGNVLCDCCIYLNNIENIDFPRAPFLIGTRWFAHNFDEVWNNWLQFYNENRVIPTLFYEIICNHSTHINRFLNLSQSLELYSRYYREKSAWELAMRDKYPYRNLSLKYRIEDILLYLDGYIEIEPEKIPILAKKISDFRNYFTHYDRTRQPEPSFYEVSSANIILRYILLVIVYKTVGIEQQYISECRRRSEYKHLKEDISIILKENKSLEHKDDK